MTGVLYVSLQGDDKILRFALDGATGDLERLGETEVPGGPAPMAVDPSQRCLHVARRGECKISSFDPACRYLYAAGLESGRLGAHRIDAGSGSLEPIKTYPLGRRPMWVSTLNLAA